MFAAILLYNHVLVGPRMIPASLTLVVILQTQMRNQRLVLQMP
jgi:hypothetical protein